MTGTGQPNVGLVGAATKTREILAGGFVEQVPVDLGSEDRVRQFDLADLLAV